MQRFVNACLAGALAALSLPAAAQSAGKAPGSAFRDCEACPEMVVLPAGSFVMGTPGHAGSPGEAQATAIRIARPFALARTEVTRAQFAQFVADSGHEPKPGCVAWTETLGRWHDDGRRTWQNPGLPVAPVPTHPVSCVSWADARDYAQWLAQKTGKPYRLPSEAEWEYAARAGSSTLRPWGDAPEGGCDEANVYDASGQAARRLGWAAAACSDGQADVAPAAALQANAFGLHDLIGNVAEWVQDCATASYVGRPRDGRAWTWVGGCREHVQRGGSWADDVAVSRSAHRVFADEAARSDTVGFRVALDLEPARGEPR